MKRIILIVIVAVCLICTTCVLLVCCKKDKNPNNSIEPMYTEDSLVNSSKSSLIMTLLKDGFKLSFGSVMFYFMFNLSPVLVGYNLFYHEKENLL